MTDGEWTHAVKVLEQVAKVRIIVIGGGCQPLLLLIIIITILIIILVSLYIDRSWGWMLHASVSFASLMRQIPSLKRTAT